MGQVIRGVSHRGVLREGYLGGDKGGRKKEVQGGFLGGYMRRGLREQGG